MTCNAPQRALRPKVRAASLFPRALSTAKHASKLSHAPCFFCDSSRSCVVERRPVEKVQSAAASLRHPRGEGSSSVARNPGQASRPLERCVAARAELRGSYDDLGRLSGAGTFAPRCWSVSSKPICQKLSGVSGCLVTLEAMRWREGSWWHRCAVSGDSTPPAASKKPLHCAHVTASILARAALLRTTSWKTGGCFGSTTELDEGKERVRRSPRPRLVTASDVAIGGSPMARSAASGREK